MTRPDVDVIRLFCEGACLRIVTLCKRCTQVVLIVVGLLGFFEYNWVGAAERPATAPPSSPVEQALVQVTSEDESVREAVIRILIEQDDVSLVPRLDEIRASADRCIWQAINPVMDLFKNRANVSSDDADVRRSTATDLGSVGRPVAISWLKQAAEKGDNRGVCYTMEESTALLSLASDDPVVKIAAAEATEQQKDLAKAVTAVIERIET